MITWKGSYFVYVETDKPVEGLKYKTTEGPDLDFGDDDDDEDDEDDDEEDGEWDDADDHPKEKKTVRI